MMLLVLSADPDMAAVLIPPKIKHKQLLEYRKYLLWKEDTWQ